MVITSFALMVLAYISGHANTAYFLLVPYVPGSAELMVLAGAMAGATLGFLWFNAHPARVFMGDTGSLALGALMGYIGVVTRNEFLLPVIGAVYVIEISTVMMQVSWFKWTKRRYGEGRRIFPSTPIHHGFHMMGWKETQIVTRSYIVSAVAVVIALITLKIR
jgi:phospho-N-acetylmuramoyl-pentapeptide-transferase